MYCVCNLILSSDLSWLISLYLKKRKKNAVTLPWWRGLEWLRDLESDAGSWGFKPWQGQYDWPCQGRLDPKPASLLVTDKSPDKQQQQLHKAGDLLVFGWGPTEMLWPCLWTVPINSPPNSQIPLSPFSCNMWIVFRMCSCLYSKENTWSFSGIWIIGIRFKWSF